MSMIKNAQGPSPDESTRADHVPTNSRADEKEQDDEHEADNDMMSGLMKGFGSQPQPAGAKAKAKAKAKARGSAAHTQSVPAQNGQNQSGHVQTPSTDNASSTTPQSVSIAAGFMSSSAGESRRKRTQSTASEASTFVIPEIHTTKKGRVSADTLQDWSCLKR